MQATTSSSQQTLRGCYSVMEIEEDELMLKTLKKRYR